jgi:cytochrome c oxidase subunit 2
VGKYWSVLFGIVILLAAGLFVVSPANGWWLPPNVSSFGHRIDNLFYLILWITGFFFLLTEGLLVFAMYRYAEVPGRKAPYVHGNHKLEVLWTVVPAAILVLIGVVQINTWSDIKYERSMPRPGRNTQQIEVTARQWEWRMRYPSPERMDRWSSDEKLAQDFGSNPHVDDIHVTNELHIWSTQKDDKEKQKVLVHLKTRDVIHSLKLVDLRLMQDALPGKTIKVWLDSIEYNCARDPKDGKWKDGYDPEKKEFGQVKRIWEISCAEFCATRHTAMKGHLFVHNDKADFLAWLQATQKEQNRHSRDGDDKTVASAQ